MKRLVGILLVFSLALVCGCTKKQEHAQLTYLDENQVEQTFIIKKTEDSKEIKELASIVKAKKIETSFNGLKLKLNSDINGKVIVETKEQRSIDVGYKLDLDAKVNLKKYRLSGEIKLDGFTDIKSPSLSFKTQDNLTSTIINDDSFLYLTGDLQSGNNQVKVKHKINIEEFTTNYKAKIIAALDVLKYYKLEELIPNIEELVDLYQITIADTTKDTFTIRLNLASEKLFPNIDAKEMVYVDIIISCDTLLPIEISLSLDALIANALKTEYVKQYLTDKVSVKEAKGMIHMNMEYGNFNIEELKEAEKQEYKEYT